MGFQIAGWSSLVARQAHNLKVVGSNPAPATNFVKIWLTTRRGVAQPGSAFAWGAKGHEFKSRRSDHFIVPKASQVAEGVIISFGGMAERLGRGLQIRLQRFNSASHLHFQV